MPGSCAKGTTGGKGNFGMFIERNKNICAAGFPTAQPDESVGKHLQHYLLQEEVDALVHDAIIPPKPNIINIAPNRKQTRDVRHANFFSEGKSLIYPPEKSKFQFICEDFKNTVYSSYWKQPIGKSRDPAPNLPVGLNVKETIFGKKTPNDGRLYDIIMPKDSIPDITPETKTPGYQSRRYYCRPSFDPNIVFGKKSFTVPGGKLVKCCLQYDDILLGKSRHCVISSRQADFLDAKGSYIGRSVAPNDNISNVPPGHAFGKRTSPENSAQCFKNCEINPDKEFFMKCLAHLNTVRICLKKRFDSKYFHALKREFKYYDKNNSGWLPKETIYNVCKTKYIRFDPVLTEPLLSTWYFFNGFEIVYKSFIDVLNPLLDIPPLPKFKDIHDECVDLSTIYRDVFNTVHEKDDKPMAGTPSGRYLDKEYPITPPGCCKADRFYLPEESDAKSCLNPSVLTLYGINHRDMFAERSPDIVRKVFESATKTNFTDEQFEELWQEAKKCNSRGLVCFETFRRVLTERKLL